MFNKIKHNRQNGPHLMIFIAINGRLLKNITSHDYFMSTIRE